MGTQDLNYIQLKFNSHLEASFNNLAFLRDKQVFTDLILTCCGQFYPAHRLVVSSCSEYLARSLQSIPAFCLYPIILLDGLSLITMEALLTFMYTGLVTVHRDDLPELLEAGQRLGIKGLVRNPASEEARPTQPTERASQHSKVSSDGPARHRRASSGAAAATTTTTTTSTATATTSTAAAATTTTTSTAAAATTTTTSTAAAATTTTSTAAAAITTAVAAATVQTLMSNTMSEELVSVVQTPDEKEKKPSQADVMAQLIKPFACEQKASENKSNDVTIRKNSQRRSFDEALYPESEIVMSHALPRKVHEKIATVEKRGREDSTKDGSCHKRSKLSELVGVKAMAANSSTALSVNLALGPPTSRGSPRRQVKKTKSQDTERNKVASSLKGEALLVDSTHKQALDVTTHSPRRKTLRTQSEQEPSRDQSAARKSPRILNSPQKAATGTNFPKTLGVSLSSLDITKAGCGISCKVDEGSVELSKPDAKKMTDNSTCEYVTVKEGPGRIGNVTAEFGKTVLAQENKPSPPSGSSDTKDDAGLEKREEKLSSLQSDDPETPTDATSQGRVKDANVRRVVRTMAPVVRKMTSSSLVEAVAADSKKRAPSGATEEAVALAKSPGSLDQHTRKKKKKFSAASDDAETQQLPVKMESDEVDSEAAERGDKLALNLERAGPSAIPLIDLSCGEAAEELDLLDPDDDDEDDSDPASSSFEGWSSPKYNETTARLHSSGPHRPKSVYGGRGPLLKTGEGRPHRRRVTTTKSSNPYAKAYHRISSKSPLHKTESREDPGSHNVNGAMEVDTKSILSSVPLSSDEKVEDQNEIMEGAPLDSTELSSLSTKQLMSSISKSVISQAPAGCLSKSPTSDANIKYDNDVQEISNISSASGILKEKRSVSTSSSHTTHASKPFEFKGSHTSSGINEGTVDSSKPDTNVAESRERCSMFSSPQSPMMRAQQALQHCKSISVTRTPPSTARTELALKQSRECSDASQSLAIKKKKKKKRRVNPTLAPLDRKVVDPVRSAKRSQDTRGHKPLMDKKKTSVGSFPGVGEASSARSVASSIQRPPGAPMNVLQSVGSHLRLQSAGPSGLSSALVSSGSTLKNINFDDPSMRRCIIRRVQASEVLSLLGARSSVTISAASPSSSATPSQRPDSSLPPSRVTPVSIGGFTLPVSSSVILVPKLASVSSSISALNMPTPSTSSSGKQTLLTAVVGALHSSAAAAFSPMSTSCSSSDPSVSFSHTLPKNSVLHSLLTTSTSSLTTLSIAKPTSVASSSLISTLPSTTFVKKQQTGFIAASASTVLTSRPSSLSGTSPQITSLNKSITTSPILKPATSYRTIRPAASLPYRTNKLATTSQSTKPLTTSPGCKPATVASKAFKKAASDSGAATSLCASLSSPSAVTFTTVSGTECVASRSPSTLATQRALLSSKSATDPVSAVTATAPNVTQPLPLSVITQPVIASVISERQGPPVLIQSAVTSHVPKLAQPSSSVASDTPLPSAKSVSAASVVRPTTAIRPIKPTTSVATTSSTPGITQQRPILPLPTDASNPPLTLLAGPALDAFIATILTTPNSSTATTTTTTTAASSSPTTSCINTLLHLPSEPQTSPSVAAVTDATALSFSVSPAPTELLDAPEQTQHDASRKDTPPAGTIQPPAQLKAPEPKLAGVQSRSQRTMMCKTCRAAFTDPSELLHHTLHHH